jgi:hypothetical protein
MEMVLDDRITQKIRKTQEELTSQGSLPTRTQLEEYYGRFRERFGSRRLEALDGEVLLETMHDHGNRDSLVYWLEFKNDEEFPARFGSIAGGSALKFGIYRRKETGAWLTGSPQHQQELSIQEAIQIARRHWDQFIERAVAAVHGHDPRPRPPVPDLRAGPGLAVPVGCAPGIPGAGVNWRARTQANGGLGPFSLPGAKQYAKGTRHPWARRLG